jgi:transposase
VARREELTGEQWAIIAPLIPEPPRLEDGRGRSWKDSREVINCIIWVLRSGARWGDLPDRFPPYQHGSGLPLSVHTSSALPHEVSLVTDTLLESFAGGFPERLIGDKAYDSGPLDVELATAGIEVIAPHRGDRKKPATQDGRPLRRYHRGYKVERLFAWLKNFRRLVVRYEYHLENFLGSVHLGCILILLRYYLCDGF